MNLSSQNDNSDIKSEFIKIVKSKGYEKRELPFRLSSGGFSNDYVDMRKALSDGPDLALSAKYLLHTLELRGLDFDVVGGMTMGADPISHAVAILSGKSWFSVRKQEKTHGTKRRIEGAAVNEKTKVLLVEDTVSTGRSVLEALEVVKSQGAEVRSIVVLLDRGIGMSKKMTEENMVYIPLITYQDLGIDPL